MPQNFYNKVQYICRQIKEVEWSGILFYELKGSMANPSKSKIILKDIFLMDRGTKTLTEYDFDSDEESAGDIVELMMTKPEYKKYQRGLIHSHNTMNVFFSDIDQDELIRSSEFYNFYLSLIVNSFMEFTAKVAFRANVKISSNFTANNEIGKQYKLINPLRETTVVYTYDTNIFDTITITSGFAERVNKIMESCDKRDAKKAKDKPAVLFNTTNITNQAKQAWSKDFKPNNVVASNFIQEGFANNLLENFEIDQKYTDFATFLLRLGNTQTGRDGDDDIEDAIEDCIINDVTKSMPSAIMNQFIELHSKFFDESEPEAQSLEFVLNSLVHVIEIYEEYEDSYTWLSNVVMTLRSFGNQLSKTN